jgi:hypothetical protein
MARLYSAALVVALSALSACATPRTPEPRIVTQRVEIPIEVRREVPGDLATCTDHLPIPQLEDAPGGVLVPFAEIPKLTQMIGMLARCDAAWRVWAASP